jgi:hypothetical protein
MAAKTSEIKIAPIIITGHRKYHTPMRSVIYFKASLK